MYLRENQHACTPLCAFFSVKILGQEQAATNTGKTNPSKPLFIAFSNDRLKYFPFVLSYKNRSSVCPPTINCRWIQLSFHSTCTCLLITHETRCIITHETHKIRVCTTYSYKLGISFSFWALFTSSCRPLWKQLHRSALRWCGILRFARAWWLLP